MSDLPFNKVLALSPHTDDIEFGCGGTLARLIEEGKEIHTAVFSICEESVPEGYPKDILLTEMRAASEVLGIPADHQHVFRYPVRRFNEHRQDILEDLISLKRKIQPDLIFTPSTFDVHQDHETISKESIRAFRYQTLLGYELPWNNLENQLQLSITLSSNHLRIKTDSLGAYKSQKFRHYGNESLFMALSLIRGTQTKSDSAESFEVIRMNF